MIAYGCGKGMIHRNVQPEFTPELKEPVMKQVIKPAKSEAKAVSVTDIQTGEMYTFTSAAETAKAIGCGETTVRKRLREKSAKPFRNRYIMREAL